TDALNLRPQPTTLMLEALIRLGVVERYDEDYALSALAQLLCQHDRDLGDEIWSNAEQRLRVSKDSETVPTEEQPADPLRIFGDRIAATQWTHTKSAIQAAEVLDIGGQGNQQLRVLDLASGSAVWSSAMAFRDPGMRVVAVDHAMALAAARATVKSIDLERRFEFLDADPIAISEGSLPADDPFDMVLIAQRLHLLNDEDAIAWLRRVRQYLKPDGRIVVIDLFHGPPSDVPQPLVEILAALKVELGTRDGSVRTIEQSNVMLRAAGFSGGQFTFLPDSAVQMGLHLATCDPVISAPPASGSA
ncbi:MAG: class I SAM-dependent methyltransferase, partial [Planctomycetota bacterium]